ncbi:hypothetical protein M1446_03830 [Candidatus Dependentiae bacterium]|nr:hypothetical protein [Candidatus Dependentiae bacterium]
MKKLFLTILLSFNILLFAEAEYFWQKAYNKQVEDAIKNSKVDDLKSILEIVKLTPEEKAFFLNMIDEAIKDQEENLNNFSMFSNSKLNMKLIPHKDSLVFQDYLSKFTVLVASTGLVAYLMQEDPDKEDLVDKAKYGIPFAGVCAILDFILIFNNGIKTYRVLKNVRDEAYDIKEIIEEHNKSVEIPPVNPV